MLLSVACAEAAGLPMLAEVAAACRSLATAISCSTWPGAENHTARFILSRRLFTGGLIDLL